MAKNTTEMTIRPIYNSLTDALNENPIEETSVILTPGSVSAQYVSNGRSVKIPTEQRRAVVNIGETVQMTDGEQCRAVNLENLILPSFPDSRRRLFCKDGNNWNDKTIDYDPQSKYRPQNRDVRIVSSSYEQPLAQKQTQRPSRKPNFSTLQEGLLKEGIKQIYRAIR